MKRENTLTAADLLFLWSKEKVGNEKLVQKWEIYFENGLKKGSIVWVNENKMCFDKYLGQTMLWQGILEE